MLISSAFICVIGIIYGVFTGFRVINEINGQVVVLAAILAAMLTANICFSIFGAKYGSFAIIIMFAMLGTIVISTVYGLVYDPVRNKLNVYNILGIAVVVVIIVLGYVNNRNGKTDDQNTKKNKKIFAGICLAVFLLNGSALSIYSFFTSTNKQYGEINYIFLYSFFCMILCVILIAIIVLCKRGSVPEIAVATKVKPLLCTVTYGGAFMLSEFCSLLNTSVLPIVIQAPLSFAINIISVAIVDFIFFKQKLTKAQTVQIALSFVVGVLFAF